MSTLSYFSGEVTLMMTPIELRMDSRRYLESSRLEDSRVLKQMLAKHALALAQLAERIERDDIEQNVVK